MGFSSEALETGFASWRLVDSSRSIRWLLSITAVCSFLRTLAHVPDSRAIWSANILVLSTLGLVYQMVRPTNRRQFQYQLLAVVWVDFVTSLPTFDATLPAILAVFAAYTVLVLPFSTVLLTATAVSALQISAMMIGNGARINELLAIAIFHLWAHFTGIYLYVTKERIARNAFLSAHNSYEAEKSAQQQGCRLNQLLAAFLPPHLLVQARQQIATNHPHIYNEAYTQVSVLYGRLNGFEACLSQVTAIDAARVLKEINQRINRIAQRHGVTLILSEGITAVSSIPGIDSEHATKLCNFALELEALIESFRGATLAEVSLTIGIDSGPIAAGIVGTSKWHYDVIGEPYDNAILLQSSVENPGIYLTGETRRFLSPDFQLEMTSNDTWRLCNYSSSTEGFPAEKRFSLVTVPQAINRLLQGVCTIDAAAGTCKKRKPEKEKMFDMTEAKESNKSIMYPISLKFRNDAIEMEYHKEMDHWFIPSLAISIFFLVLYGIYHMLVMPRLITSLILIIIALTLLFIILLMLYIDYFHSFSQFITKTSSGHAITVLLVITVLFLCGIVNTFSCPQPMDLTVCRTAHFSTFSFGLWVLTTGVFLRFPSICLAVLYSISIVIYTLQIWTARADGMTAKEFATEFDLACYLLALSCLVLLHCRACEKLLRLDFLAVVKGLEETSTRERMTSLSHQTLLNLVPAHVAAAVSVKGRDLWNHSYNSVGVAYLAVSGFPLIDENGLNSLNYVFSYMDQIISNFKGVEKIKNANRFYIIAVGLLPDASQNVDETPWTIGELLFTMSQFLLEAAKFAEENDFHVQIGMDCGSALAVISDVTRPRYELFGETVEKARILMQTAGHDMILASEEIYLALRPRPVRFARKPIQISPQQNAYELLTESKKEEMDETMSREEQKRHMEGIIDAEMRKPSWQSSEMELASSIVSTMSSELRSIDDDAETDSELEWVSPETALMQKERSTSSASRRYGGYRRRCDYNPYREPSEHYDNNDRALNYSEFSDSEQSLATSRSSFKRWRPSSRTSLQKALGIFKREKSASEKLENVATRVDKMIQELNAYDEFSDVKPLEYQPFPMSNYGGSLKSVARATSSACHTEYDNAESEAVLSEDAESEAARTPGRPKKLVKKWAKRNEDTESQCSSVDGSEFNNIRWKSVHSIGYENEYEMEEEESEGDDDDRMENGRRRLLPFDQMAALSRDIRANFGDFQLSTFADQ